MARNRKIKGEVRPGAVHTGVGSTSIISPREAPAAEPEASPEADPAVTSYAAIRAANRVRSGRGRR